MLTIRLPDDSNRQYPAPLSVAEVVKDIGSGLAKAALAAKVNTQLVDLSFSLDEDCQLEVITKDHHDGLELLRHSTAHLLAHAVKHLYPSAQITIGPVIENGFYYDIAYDRPFTPEDLVRLEKTMAQIAKENHAIEREVWLREEAIDFFTAQGELYKAQIIKDLPETETITVYRQGNFADLCRGPHVPTLKHLKIFKLMKVAGAYWRGDSNNEQLQRIYGTAWSSKAQLDDYLFRLEEAERRDHRRLGKQLDLFHLQDAAPGLIFWHPNGYVLWQVIEQYLRKKLDDQGYQEVKTPQILDRSLWQQSGHWDMYSEHMFTTSSENRDYAVKPMNCPGHIQIFNQGLKSYRDLPLRLAEFGSCHRNEPSGALHGIMRVRGFVQDDAHIFCTEQQILEESVAFIRLVQQVYQDFGFDALEIALSTRPEKRIGQDSTWDKAENALQEALDLCQLPFSVQAGEGAFYGPKIEFSLRDCLHRVWQCGTLQLDFALPDRLNASYVGEDNQKHTPVMLHRAVLGSLERFIGILIEQFAGAMPIWLAPIQMVVMTISEKQLDYAHSVKQTLLQAGLRVSSDFRGEKINLKIRENSLKKPPYLIIIGDNEKTQQCISVRQRGGKNLGTMAIDDFIGHVHQECQKLARTDDADANQS